MADKVVSVRLIARVGQYASEMNQAAQVTSNFSGHLTGQVGRAQQAVTNLGTAAALAGKVTLLGIGAAMVVSAKAAIDFESSLASVAKTTDLSGASLAQFGRSLRGLSLDIPVNVNELAEIAALGGQLGITENNLLGFTDTIAKLGATTNLSATEGGTAMARFVSIMQSSQSDIPKLGSVVVELGNNFATTESELINFGLRLAPIGSTVGLTEAGVLALGTALSQLGITPERGATAIQKLFTDMDQAVAGSGEELDDFARAAQVSAEEFAAAYEQDPLVALQMLSRGLDQVQDSGGDVFTVLDQIGVRESRAIGVTLALANGVEVLGDAYEMAQGQIDEATALQEEAALRFGTTASQIQILGNAFNDLRIELGDAFLDTGLLTSWIDSLKEFLGIMRDNIGVVQGLGAALGILSGLSILNFFVLLAMRSFESARGMLQLIKVTEGVTRSMQIMRVSSLALHASFGILGIATAALGLIWFNQARKAAKLRDAVRELNAAVDAGTDVETAIGDRLLGELDPSTIRALQDAGLTVRDIASAMADGTADVDEFADAIRNVFVLSQSPDQAGVQALFGGFRDTGLRNAEAPIKDLSNAITELDAVARAFREGQLDKFVDNFRELNPETELTAEQIRNMGQAIQETEGADLSNWAQNITTAAGVAETAVKAMGMSVINTDDQISSRGFAEMPFLEQVFSLEDGAEKYDAFVGSILDATGQFRDDLSETFLDLQEGILSSVPAWDEYDDTVKFVMGSVTEEMRDQTLEQKGIFLRSIEDITAATDEWLADYEAWVRLQPELLASASQGVIDYLDTLSLAEKAGIADLTKAEFDALIADLERRFGDTGEAAMLMSQFWQARLPAIVRESGGALLTAIEDAVGVIVQENPGIDAGEALTEGIVTAVRDFTDDPELQQLLIDMFTDSGVLSQMLGAGFENGDAIIRGILDALRAGKSSIDTELERMTRYRPPSTTSSGGGGGGSSPGSGGVQPKTIYPMSTSDLEKLAFSSAGAPSSTTNASAVYNSRTVHVEMPVYNPTSKDLEDAVEKSTLKLQRTVRYAETAW